MAFSGTVNCSPPAHIDSEDATGGFAIMGIVEGPGQSGEYGDLIKDGVIEIQGNHRDTLVAELEGRGFTVKRAGG